MTLDAARSREQRRRDTVEKLGNDVDLWVASADETGNAYLVPLSFYWDGSTITIATPRASRTARNLVRAGWARVALGPTRDVVIVEGDPDRNGCRARGGARGRRRLRPTHARRRVRVPPDHARLDPGLARSE